MNRRKALGLTIFGFALIGPIFLAIPYLSAFLAGDDSKRIVEVKIDTTKLPDQGVFVESLRGYKAIIVRNPEIEVFVMPYVKEAYILPYPSRERPLVSCKKFFIRDDGFSCEDSSLPEIMRNDAKWDLSGKSQGKWMQDLEKIEFHMEGKQIVFDLVYK